MIFIVIETRSGLNLIDRNTSAHSIRIGEVISMQLGQLYRAFNLKRIIQICEFWRENFHETLFERTVAELALRDLMRRDTKRIGFILQGILKGEYRCTIDLLFDWFGISCMTIDNFCFYFHNRLIQTSQTGGQQYSDTYPLVFPVFCVASPKPIQGKYN